VFGSVVVVCGVFVWGVGVFVGKFFFISKVVFLLLREKFLVLFCTVLVGVWAQLAPVGELPVVVRCRSRVRSEEPIGD
jgi:hypothetical protein